MMRFLHRVLPLLLVIVNAACGAPPAPATRVAATQTRAPADVPATATGTASPSATIPLLPTLTPAAPAANANAYHLAAQTADQADETIIRLEQAIPTLGEDPRYSGLGVGGDGIYVAYYRATWYAAWNALAHFPADPRAEAWRWKMAHYQALSGELQEADQLYGEVIATALNTAHVPLQDLPGHVLLGNGDESLYLPAFVMKIDPVQVPHTEHGFIASIGNLNRPDTPIAACFLLAENGGTYQVYFIQDSFLSFGYSIMSRDSINCSMKDVTDDGIAEIATNRYSGGHNGSYTFQVFDVTSLPPKTMPFITDDGARADKRSNTDYVRDYPMVGGKMQLQFNDSIGDLNCGNYQSVYFQWTGTAFEPVRRVSHFEIPSRADGFTFCVDEALGGLYSRNNKDAAAFLEEAIQAYRPYSTQIGDILNEMIARQAIYYALLGEQEKARSTLAGMVQAPLVTPSIWTGPAKKFLDAYQKPEDLYRACSQLSSCTPYRGIESAPGVCLEISLCDSDRVLEYTLANVDRSVSLEQLPAILKKIGIDIAGEGWIDLERDQKPERWFTLGDLSRKDELNLWIIAESPKGNVLLDAGYYDPNIPEPVFQVGHTLEPPYFITLQEDDSFELLRDPQSGEPYLSSVDTENLDGHKQAMGAELDKFRQLQRQLLAGNQPLPIYEQILEIDRRYENCPFKLDEDDFSSYDCADFYYTLAFSAEQAGQEVEAAKRYYAVWAVYPDTPFALLARLKLER